ncbi:polyhomeotic-like protein 3 isoform X2 [Astyanax mexicanus]|uniref:Polyhomeotic-like protein 3 n=2 Tax=Astyanax mexicanus TaxID=7994 RepID=A0A8B9KUY2_ASTMX|nr:polyhomeotic-like protein 3 isoform X2 [Astyanax mexicanus]
MDKEPQAKPEPAKSASSSAPTATTTTTIITTTTTSSTVTPSQQANGTPKSTPSLTAVTTFHNQPPPTDRKVVQVNLFGDRLAPAFSTAVSSSQQTPKAVSVPTMPGSPSLVRANQSSSPTGATRKISPQTLLLGKSPCSQAQMLLRAQMLQSLTLRPPPPGTLTIPPNLPLKSAASRQPPTLSRPRAPTFTLRPSPPPSGKEATSKTEGTTPQLPTLTPKAPPVRHLTVPPPSLYAPAQSHAMAKQNPTASGSLKRPHSQISIPQHPFPQRQTHPNSSPTAPKKPLPELKRCPSTQSSQSGSAQVSTVAITVPTPSRSHLTPPTMTLPLSSSSPGGSLLATKQLLRIALSSASAQCTTNGQSKTTTLSPPRDVVQSKPLVSPVLAKPECPVQSPQTSNPQLVQLSPSRQMPAAPLITAVPRLSSPQRASPPSPVLPLVSTSSSVSSAPSQSPLASQSPVYTVESSKEHKSLKEKRKQADGMEEAPQDLKLTSAQMKSVEQTLKSTTIALQSGEAVDKSMVSKRMLICTEGLKSENQIKLSQKSEIHPASAVASPAEREDLCEDMSTHSDNHSAISSLSSDLSPVQSSVIRPSDASPASCSSPPKFPAVLDRQPAQRPTSSHTGPAEAQHSLGMSKPLVLTHLVEGFIIQEGLEPFPVSRSSLMVEPHCGSGVNGVSGPDLFPATSDPPDDSTDSDDDAGVTNNGVGGGHRLVLQCQFCKRKGTAQTFPRSKRFCSKSCAKRFSYTKRFRALRRCVSEGGHRSEFNGAGDEIQEERFQQVKHGATEQWRILQRPPQEGEDEAAAPMKTRLRRHTEQGPREREMRTREMVAETRSAPTSPLDTVSPTDLSSRPKPAQWTVDEVSSFISSLPGCQDIAESFRAQEIDGQALLLLTEDHLMSAMNVKLGPALKICARINSLKEGGR